MYGSVCQPQKTHVSAVTTISYMVQYDDVYRRFLVSESGDFSVISRYSLVLISFLEKYQAV